MLRFIHKSAMVTFELLIRFVVVKPIEPVEVLPHFTIHCELLVGWVHITSLLGLIIL
jgi:hypothetical protein